MSVFQIAAAATIWEPWCRYWRDVYGARNLGRQAKQITPHRNAMDVAAP